MANKICEAYNIKPESIVMINSDMGQLYERIGIGTAKPNIGLSLYPHCLFGELREPINYTAYQFREYINGLVHEVWEKNQIPIIIGGTGFYLKSLFFSSNIQNIEKNDIKTDYSKFTSEQLWNKLQEIDPKRADDINKNDRYRLERALDIWVTTGKKPSEFKEIFKPIIENCYIYYLSLPKLELKERVKLRTEHMFKEGWLKEAHDLTPEWKELVIKKNIIGYPEIINYLSLGYKENKDKDFENLKDIINIRTVQYIKKQETFFKLLIKTLKLHNNTNTDKIWFKQISEINPKTANINDIIKNIKNEFET